MHQGPVEVAQDAFDVVALSKRVIEEIGVLPAVDRQQDRLVGEQATVMLGMHEIVPQVRFFT